MNFADRPPSERWAVLKFRGEPFAEVWFKPEGDPLAVAVRVPRGSFEVAELAPLLTAENLLKAVGIPAAEIESWGWEIVGEELESDPHQPLLPPPEGETHRNLCFRRTEETGAPGGEDSREGEVPEAWWQEVESRWNAVLGLEASIDTLRISMEGLRAELESLGGKSLSPEEKVNALNADVAQWTKAKSRVVYALPKLRDFIHRSTWAAGTPERKHLEELYKSHIRLRIPFAEMEQVVEQLGNLLKDRQVLSALGMAAYQECKGVAADVHGSLRTLQANAASNAARKKGQNNARNRSY